MGDLGEQAAMHLRYSVSGLDNSSSPLLLMVHFEWSVSRSTLMGLCSPYSSTDNNEQGESKYHCRLGLIYHMGTGIGLLPEVLVGRRSVHGYGLRSNALIHYDVFQCSLLFGGRIFECVLGSLYMCSFFVARLAYKFVNESETNMELLPMNS